MYDLFNDYILNESINDQNLLKAFIFGGGPGSGKTYIIKNMFPKNAVRLLDSDKIFMKFLEDYSFGFKFNQYSQDALDFALNQLRPRAKEIGHKFSRGYIDSLLPIVIDSTGQYSDVALDQKEILESLGYDVYYIYVYTDLEIAQKRNQQRSRTLEPEVLEKIWLTVFKNKDTYKKIFGDHFVEIDNSKDSDSDLDFEMYLFRTGQRLLKSPLENEIGIDLLDQLKNKKLKYRRDIDPKSYKVKI